MTEISNQQNKQKLGGAENVIIPPPLVTMDGNTLMAQEYEPLGFSIDQILPHGVFVFAGSPKVGKSWLTLDMCRAISTGGKQWDFSSTQGDVLYLALEDNFRRLHSRIKQMKAEGLDISHLHLATSSCGIQNGLLEQVHSFIAENPNTNFIAIDTLERIRGGMQENNIYACDYREMTKIREITDKHNITLLLVHHTRKMYDSDPLNTVSGSTGLVGAVDGVFVLVKNKRTGNDAKLNIINRDTKTFCFDLRFDEESCCWEFIGNSAEEGNDENILVIAVDEFLQDEWSGTATELSKILKQAVPDLDITPATIGKQLRSLVQVFRKDFGIAVDFDRDSGRKQISIKRIKSQSVVTA